MHPQPPLILAIFFSVLNNLKRKKKKENEESRVGSRGDGRVGAGSGVQLSGGDSF
jgi:hypothetical protein